LEEYVYGIIVAIVPVYGCVTLGWLLEDTP